MNHFKHPIPQVGRVQVSSPMLVVHQSLQALKQDTGPVRTGSDARSDKLPQKIEIGVGLETLERFQTNPYFYFLGQFVRASITSRPDQTGVLLQSLQRLIDNEHRRTDLHAPDLGDGMLEMVHGETLYPVLVRENTVRELGRLKDPQAVPLLTTLLGHGNRQVRLLSVRALGAIRVDEARPAIERVAQQDGDREVRQAAAAALAGLPGSSQVP